MQLFYDPEITAPEHTLAEEESKHCIRVLRMACGDELHMTDGRGNLYRCRIAEAHPKHCRIAVEAVTRPADAPDYRLTMAVAPTKSPDRYEWFLEKATEVGVAAFVPIESEHSERRVFKAERAEKVITAAMKQSLKLFRPCLRPMTPLREVIAAPFEGRKLIAHCAEARTAAGKSYLASTLRPGEAALVLIGPEGDFSQEEIDLAVANGFEEITLGRERLRTETAAVVATVMAAVVNAR